MGISKNLVLFDGLFFPVYTGKDGLKQTSGTLRVFCIEIFKRAGKV